MKRALLSFTSFFLLGAAALAGAQTPPPAQPPAAEQPGTTTQPASRSLNLRLDDAALRRPSVTFGASQQVERPAAATADRSGLPTLGGQQLRSFDDPAVSRSRSEGGGPFPKDMNPGQP